MERLTRAISGANRPQAPAGLPRHWALAALVAALPLFCGPALGVAAQENSSPIIAGVDKGRVVVTARFAGTFTAETMTAIFSGAPVTFTYVTQIKRKRFPLWDKVARQVIIKRMVKYDALRKSYMVWEKRDAGKDEDEINFHEELKRADYKPFGQVSPAGASPAPEKPDTMAAAIAAQASMAEPLSLATPAEMEEWMSTTGMTEMGSVESLGGPGRYYARVKLKVKSVNLSAPARFFRFFTSLLDLDSGWMVSEPFHALDGDAALTGRK